VKRKRPICPNREVRTQVRCRAKVDIASDDKTETLDVGGRPSNHCKEVGKRNEQARWRKALTRRLRETTHQKKPNQPRKTKGKGSKSGSRGLEKRAQGGQGIGT